MTPASYRGDARSGGRTPYDAEWLEYDDDVRSSSLEHQCDHGCSREATIQHADGRMLCRPCYMVETETRDSVADAMREQDPYCPTCSPWRPSVA